LIEGIESYHDFPHCNIVEFHTRFQFIVLKCQSMNAWFVTADQCDFGIDKGVLERVGDLIESLKNCFMWSKHVKYLVVWALSS
jgi:hypothetical protein